MTAGRILGLAALCTLSGCSLLLDTDDFLAVPELGDVRIDSREPMQVLEGARLPVILRGEGFSSNAVVLAIVALPGGAEEPVPVAEKRASRDGTALALVLDVPVLPDHDDADELASVQITVTQGRSTASATLEIQALPELELGLGDNQVVKTAELESLYSEIVVDGAVTVIGDDPVRLVATHAIRINRPVDASGQDATAELPGSGGPGSCAGGAGGVAGVDSGNGKNGGCDQGGGRAGTGVSGIGPAPSGGGGGCAAAAGGDDGDEARGDDTCTPELVPLGQPDNRGHGGGGGGAYESAPGGHGGGGGGVVELSAPFVSFGPYGELSARGGSGTPGAPLDCGQDRHAGSGGGGSGGVVLLRADTVLFGQEGIISVAGGTGGTICETSGGLGSDGRVRIDVAGIQLNDRPISAPETMVDFFSRNVFRGPRLADTPQLAVGGPVRIGVRGDPEVTYDLLVDSSPPVEIRGNETRELVLEPGLRGVCVALRGVIPNAPESKHCLTIAVLDP
jgi:hypothetical protein